MPCFFQLINLGYCSGLMLGHLTLSVQIMDICLSVQSSTSRKKAATNTQYVHSPHVNTHTDTHRDASGGILEVELLVSGRESANLLQVGMCVYPYNRMRSSGCRTSELHWNSSCFISSAFLWVCWSSISSTLWDINAPIQRFIFAGPS